MVECEELGVLDLGSGEVPLQLGGCDRLDVEVGLELGRCLHALLDQEPDDGRR